MRRIYYGLGVIAVLALGLFCCWPGIKGDPRQSDKAVSAADRDVDPIPEATDAPPTPASANRDASQATSRDAGIDAGPLVVDRESFMERLHVLEGADPGLAASLALEDRERFPNSPDAELRDVVLVTALHNARDVRSAERQAWYYFMHHPHGQFTEFLIELTGVHPPAVRPSR